MSTVIRIENLGKQYRLGIVGTGTISHDLRRWWHLVRGKEDPYLKIGESNDRSRKGSSDYVWALKEINLEIKRGDVLGIIGRNGAGKSTLLKLLSKITAPTTGKIIYKGRIASLLEVGTGFHPELTGRENVYLNGAILGMSRNEIRRKFDEIIDFSGCERFIDTPVKRYSSGMTVRLGFAVAAFLEPEILVVDEVLAVGDMEFQKKAIGKMQDVSRNSGRTVLFVSHNMQAIQTLTRECILLDKGELRYMGESTAVIREYLSSNTTSLSYIDETKDLKKPIIKKVECKTTLPANVQDVSSPFEIAFEIFTPGTIANAALSFQILNSSKQPVVHILNLSSENKFCDDKGIYRLVSAMPTLRLYPDTYSLKVYFADNKSKVIFQVLDDICQFEVKILREVRDYYWRSGNAVYLENNTWTIEKID